MLRLRAAEAADVPILFQLIGELADYERLRHKMVGDINDLHRHLFAEPRYAHALVAEWDRAAAGFALYFFNYSTFLCRPGLYLEDLFVRPAHRGHGIGLALLTALEQRARDARLRPPGMGGARLERVRDRVLPPLRRAAAAGLDPVSQGAEQPAPGVSIAPAAPAPWRCHQVVVPVAAPEAARRGSHAAGEETAEIGRVLESQVVGDLGDRHAGVAQLALGLDQHARMDQLRRRLAGGCARRPCAARPATCRARARTPRGRDGRDNSAPPPGESGPPARARDWPHSVPAPRCFPLCAADW